MLSANSTAEISTSVLQPNSFECWNGMPVSDFEKAHFSFSEQVRRRGKSWPLPGNLLAASIFFLFFFLFWLGRFLTIIADVLYCFSIRILCATLTEPPDRKQNEEMPLCVNEGTELASPLIYCPSWLPPAAHSFLLDGPSDSVPCSKPTEPQNHLHNSRGSLHAYQSDTCRGRWQQRQ